ncbi:MAG: thioredoxin family protein [Chitinophagales bacterium]
MVKKLSLGLLMSLWVATAAVGQNDEEILSKEVLAERLDYFFKGSWEKLQKKAAKKKQLILVDFYTDWCKVCKQMKQVVFASVEARAYFPETYMVYSLNAEDRQDVAQKFNVSQYPTYIFLNDKGEEIQRLTGMMTKTSFLQASQAAAKPIVPYTQFSFFR